MMQAKKGIALLITVMFVIVISVVIGLNLSSVNAATKMVQQERELYENTIIVEDVLALLQRSVELQRIAKEKDKEGLYFFLQTARIVPLESEGFKVLLHIKSARDRLSLADFRGKNEIYLYQFYGNYGVQNSFVDMLLDSSGGIKADEIYRSRIFEQHRSLFRDYLASQRHIEKIEQFYMNETGDNSIEQVDTVALLQTGEHNASRVDLNYATPEVWEMVAAVSADEARELARHEQIFATLEELPLGDEQKNRIKKFHTSFFEPYLNIKIDIIRENSIAHISFEYDIAQAKGYNFVYEL